MVATQQLRYACRFEGRDGEVYEWPLNNYEYQPTQQFRQTQQISIGADYAYDHMLASPWAKATGSEPIRFLLVGDTPAVLDAEYEALCNVLIRGGLGKLYTTDGAGNERWAYCKLGERPGYFSTTKAWGYTAVTLRLQRFSDWRGTLIATTGLGGALAPLVASVTPYDFVLANVGNANVNDLIVRLRANAAGGFDHPAMENLANGGGWSSTRVAGGAPHELKVDAGRYRVEYSTDDGVTYAPDWANLTVAPQQVHFITLEPDSVATNTLRLTNTGSPNLAVEYAYRPAWH